MSEGDSVESRIMARAIVIVICHDECLAYFDT